MSNSKDTPKLTREELKAKREERIKALKNLRIYGYPGSKIDPRYPEEGNATTESVRDNFAHSKYEHEQAQAAIQTLGNQINAIDGEFVSKLGDNMLGPLTLDPSVPVTADNEFVTKGYVDSHSGGGGGGGTASMEWSDLKNVPQEIEALDGTVTQSLVSGGTF